MLNSGLGQQIINRLYYRNDIGWQPRTTEPGFYLGKSDRAAGKQAGGGAGIKFKATETTEGEGTATWNGQSWDVFITIPMVIKKGGYKPVGRVAVIDNVSRKTDVPITRCTGDADFVDFAFPGAAIESFSEKNSIHIVI